VSIDLVEIVLAGIGAGLLAALELERDRNTETSKATTSKGME